MILCVQLEEDTGGLCTFNTQKLWNKLSLCNADHFLVLGGLRILHLAAVYADFYQSPWLWKVWEDHSPPCLTNIKGISALIKNESK